MKNIDRSKSNQVLLNKDIRFHKLEVIKKLYNPTYDLLSVEEKKEILEKLGFEYNLKFRYFQEFRTFGQSTFTAVYEAEDKSEFVFVPGAKVKLGLDLKNAEIKNIFNTENLEELAYVFIDYSELEECDDETINLKIKEKLEDKEFLKNLQDSIFDNLHEENTYTVHPIFVEREYKQTCWKEVSQEDFIKNEQWQKEILEYDKKGYKDITINGTINFYKEDVWKAKVCEEMTFEELLNKISEDNYSLPAKKEWEYLASKGLRTIFPWGNNIDYTMKLKHLGIDYNEKEYTLEKPNFFGLRIADDPYHREIVYDNGKFYYKGGDGGCNLCGGYGALLGYLPTSAYYENKYEIDEYINEGYDFYRRIKRIDIIKES